MNKTGLWTMLVSIVLLVAAAILQFDRGNPDMLIGQEKAPRTQRTIMTQNQTITSPTIQYEQRLSLPKEASKPPQSSFDLSDTIELDEPNPIMEEMGEAEDTGEFIDADAKIPPQGLESEEPAQDIGPFMDADTKTPPQGLESEEPAQDIGPSMDADE